MDEKLKQLFRELQDRENTRKEESDSLKARIEQFNDQMMRFESGMEQDIANGFYKDTPEDKLQQLIEDEKNKMRTKYDNEDNQLSKRLEETKKQHQQQKLSDYDKINSAIKEYHIDMILELNKANRKLAKIEAERDSKLNEIDEKISQKESEQKSKIEELDKEISRKEAERTHQIILNRDFTDVEANTKIKILEEEIERLKYQKDSIGDNDVAQIKAERESINNEYEAKLEEQNKSVQYYSQQKERAALFIGKIFLSTKSIEEIEHILFEGEEVKVEPEQPEVKPEQPEVEPEQPEVEPEQPEVEPEQPEVEPEQPEVEPEQPEVEPEQSEGETLSANETYYLYFEKNKEKIVKFFMDTIGIKKAEASNIFSNKENCEIVGEMCLRAMQPSNKNKANLCKEIEDFYWDLDSRIDIEVSRKGIKYNEELIEPGEVETFGYDEKEVEFIDVIIETFEKKMMHYSNNSKNLVYDKNIITAIAMDNCEVNENSSLQLTTSGMKKIGEYMHLIINPVEKEGSVTYDLEKMSIFKGLLNPLSWQPKKVIEFRKIAKQLKDTYATVKPGKITKAQWAVEDWFKKITTKKLSSPTIAEEKSSKKTKRNLWELSPKQKEYANNRDDIENQSNVEVQNETQEEIEL